MTVSLPAFAVGRGIPVIPGAWSMGWLESPRPVSRYQKTLEVLAGLTLNRAVLPE